MPRRTRFHAQPRLLTDETAWCLHCQQHVPSIQTLGGRRLLLPHKGQASEATGWRSLPCPGSGAFLDAGAADALGQRLPPDGRSRPPAGAGTR
jgi:hypothetical protein